MMRHLTRSVSIIAIAAIASASPAPAAQGQQGAAPAAAAAQAVPASLEMTVGSSRIVSLPGRVEAVVMTLSSVADAKPVSPTEMILVARGAGATDMVFRLEDGTSITSRLTVSVDRSALEAQLRRVFGVELSVSDYEGTLALRGMMPDVQTGAAVKQYMDSVGPRWVDLTRIAGVQQVQLRVRIAEASRTALRELAFGGFVGGSDAFGGFQAPGGSPFQPVSIGPTIGNPVGNAGFQFDQVNPVASATTLFGGIPGSNLEIYVQALSENRYVRLLAEPNLIAVSGQEATFLVGGEFPVPVVQGSVVGGGSTVTVQYKEFGVRLKFRPEVLGEGRLRLEVSPEVSELSEIGAVRQNGFTIPSVITRRSSTTVELSSGQSFAMAGLLRTKEQARASRVPVLGDLPVLGVLFRGVRYEQDQTELVVMVTADLVEPLDDGMERPMPGDLHETPNDWELFGEGKLTGATNVGNPLSRLKSLGLSGLKGPGAWRRPDDARVAAADPMPVIDSMGPAGGSDSPSNAPAQPPLPEPLTPGLATP